MGCLGRSHFNLKLQWKTWIYMTDCFLRLRTGEPVSKIANILGLLTRVNNLGRVNLKQRFNFSCCEIMLDSGTRGLLSHRWLLRVLISITLLLGEFWICILDLKSKNSQINKLLEMGIRIRIFLENWICAYISIRIPNKHLNAHLYKSPPKQLTSFNILYLVHKLQFPGVILFITMIQGHLVSLMRWSVHDRWELINQLQVSVYKSWKGCEQFLLSISLKEEWKPFSTLVVAEMSGDVFHSRRKVLTNIAQRTWWANWCFFPIGKCQGLWQGHRVHGSI